MNKKLKSIVKRYFQRISEDKWVTSTTQGATYCMLGSGFSSSIRKRQTNYVLERERERAMDYQDGKCQAILTPERLNKRQNGRRMKEDGEPMFTLTAQDKHGIYDGYRIRRLTPIECERLQGFPDNWTQYGKDNEPISDTQRYKCCGNAVTTNVITAIINEMFKEVIEDEND